MKIKDKELFLLEVPEEMRESVTKWVEELEAMTRDDFMRGATGRVRALPENKICHCGFELARPRQGGTASIEVYVCTQCLCVFAKRVSLQ